MGRGWGVVVAALAAAGCGGDEGWSPAPVARDDVATEADRAMSIVGFSGPESVRYDPEQDVWFVGNMNGEGGARDGNGFIARVSAATGAIDSLHFATGTPEAPLHAPRGMTIVSDTLWVADIDGVHGFDRRTGEHRAFVDLSSFSPGFLNDVATGADGALYVTDTGRSLVYRIQHRIAGEAMSGRDLGSPNGITFDAVRGVLVTVPWGPRGRVRMWSAAHIGLDLGRRRVAVPYIALDRVDVWALPPA